MKRLVFLGLLSAACGSSSTASPDGGPIDLLPLPSTDSAFCVTLGADYMNNVGSLAVLGLPSLTVAKDQLPGAVSGDPVVRAYGSKIYVVNRFSNSVSVIDVASWKVVSQFSTGAGTNPQDIAVTGTKAYVVTYGDSKVQVWDLSTSNPTTPSATIDLASLDSDGNPQANSIAIVNGQAYVTLDLLNAMFMPTGNGKVAVIDTSTNTLTGSLTLNYADPYDFFVQKGNTLLVPTDGDFSGTTGCLEQVQTGVPAQIGSCLVQNSDVGGTISVATVADDSSIYVAVSTFDANFNETATIRHIGVAGDVKPGTITPSSQQPNDVAFADPGYLVYNDAIKGGIRVYDTTAQHELTTDALNIGLPPARTNGIVCQTR
jgi:YVTN family beta-propeller protein